MPAFDQSAAAGGMAQSLDEMLKQAFLQQIESRRAQEAQQRIALDARQVGQGDRRLGMDEQRMSEDTRQFGITSGQAGQRIAEDTRQFDAGAPLRQAQTAHTDASTADLNRQPQEAIDTRKFTTERDATLNKNELGQIGARTAGAVRVAGVRTPTGLNPNQAMTQTRALQNDYRKVAAPAQEMQRQLGIMNKGLDAARRGDLNAGSQAILVTFQKVLDPTSVVRESEYDRSPQGLGLKQKIEGILPRLAQGGPGVPLQELESFAALAREMSDGVTQNTQGRVQNILDLATANGIDTNLITGSARDTPTPAAKPTAVDLMKKYGGG